MSTSRYIFVDEDFQKQVLNELKEIRSLLQSNKVVGSTGEEDEELMG